MTQTLTSLVDTLGAHPVLAGLIVFLACFGEALLIIGAVVPTTVLLVGVGTLAWGAFPSCRSSRQARSAPRRGTPWGSGRAATGGGA